MSDIIISPHPDDECIGLYSILVDPSKTFIILYSPQTDQIRIDESKKLKKYIPNIVGRQYYCQNIPDIFLKKTNLYYFPDPIFETHPEHRRWGSIGEQMARDGYDVIFYTTNMNAPYIAEVKDIKGKEELLNNVYPSQSDLWKYEKKYIIWEGRCKWIF